MKMILLLPLLLSAFYPIVCFADVFDFSSGLFDPQGNIRQIDYARIATERGSTLIGLCASKSAVFACFRQMGEDSQFYPEESIWVLEDNLGMAGVGLRSDVQFLVQVAHEECLQHTYAWSTPIHAKRLGWELAETFRKRAGRASKRPLAATILLAGPTSSNGVPGLFATGTEGSFIECQAIAAGRLKTECMKYLKANQEKLAQVSDEEELVRLALRTLEHVAVSVTVDELRDIDLQVGVVSQGQPFRMYSTEDLRHAIQALNQSGASR